jgi:hypothetical protein
MDPNLDNRLLLEALEKCCRLNQAALETALNECRREYAEAADARKAQLKEDLARTHAISGSAVVPNLETDAQWHREQAALRRRFESLLNQEKDKALQG